MHSAVIMNIFDSMLKSPVHSAMTASVKVMANNNNKKSQGKMSKKQNGTTRAAGKIVESEWSDFPLNGRVGLRPSLQHSHFRVKQCSKNT